jgi:hypothetical protein
MLGDGLLVRLPAAHPSLLMPTPPKRDNAYYLGRLEREHPTAFADFQAGTFRSLNEALWHVGLKVRRTRLHELKNAWVKASGADKQAFLKWLKLLASKTTAAPVASPSTLDGYLQPWAKTRIQVIMTTLKLDNGEVMDELGIPRHDTSLWMALSRKARIRSTMITALDKWLHSNAAI